MKKLAVMLALIPTLACASEWWGVVNLTSVHGKTKKDMNERNFGLGVEYHYSPEVVFMGGAFHNSHRKNSVYALAGWTPVKWRGARFGITGGLVNNYPTHNNGKVFPAAAGLNRFEGKRFGSNILIIPPFVKDTPLRSDCR